MSPGTGRGAGRWPTAGRSRPRRPSPASRCPLRSARSWHATFWAHPQDRAGSAPAESAAAQQVAPARRSAPRESNPPAGPSPGSCASRTAPAAASAAPPPAGGGTQGKATIRRPDRAGGVSGHPGPATALSAGQRRPSPGCSADAAAPREGLGSVIPHRTSDTALVRGPHVASGLSRIGDPPVQKAEDASISGHASLTELLNAPVLLPLTQRDPGIPGRGDERMPQGVWADSLAIPARRATRRTVRPAPFRSSRRPSAARKIGPSARVRRPRASHQVTTRRLTNGVGDQRPLPSADLERLKAEQDPWAAARRPSGSVAAGAMAAAICHAARAVRHG